MITGEPMAVSKAVGDKVFGSTMNQDGMILVRASSIGADTALAQIVKLVEEAQMGKAPIQEYADRIASVFTPTIIAVSLAPSSFGSRSRSRTSCRASGSRTSRTTPSSSRCSSPSPPSSSRVHAHSG